MKVAVLAKPRAVTVELPQAHVPETTNRLVSRSPVVSRTRSGRIKHDTGWACY